MKKQIKNILKEFKKSDDMMDNISVEDEPCLTIVNEGYYTYRIRSHDDFERAEEYLEHIQVSDGLIIDYKQATQLKVILDRFFKDKKINTEI